MKRIILSSAMLATALIAKSDTFIESNNIVSDGYMAVIQDVPLVRLVNGGTVITPEFDETCPEELKAPFSYACKIVEEYMPPCLPLRVKVSCRGLNGVASGTVSKVYARSKEHFGNSSYYDNAQMSVIKGVILAELGHNSTRTYLDYVPDVQFLTEEPDIEIVYNKQLFNQMSFSLETDPGQSYDFVSLAIRDLLKGLGLANAYRFNPATKELLDPERELTPFESVINQMLGESASPAQRLANATKGEFLLHNNGVKRLKLYAPSPWQNGLSLNYFIPQEDCSVSNILSYNFCKGMVTRSLNDDYAGFIFRDLLGWKADYTSGVSDPEYAAGGNTSLLLPYNGSLSINSGRYGIAGVMTPEPQGRGLRSIRYSDNEELNRYIDSFQPFIYNGNEIADEATSVAVLKKDGTWDVIQHIDQCLSYFTLNFTNFRFNHDESQYARTVDGYLRARITTQRKQLGRYTCNSTFFVIDYLPQKVNLSYSRVTSSAAREITLTPSNLVRIYFSNTEGVDRIVLQCLREGARLPGKIDITDVKKGYYEMTVDRTTTFTAVAYNENGTSVGTPITVVPASETPELSFSLDGNRIIVKSTKPFSDDCECHCIKIGSATVPRSIIPTFDANGNMVIDIRPLSSGSYILYVMEGKQHVSGTFKFQK